MDRDDRRPNEADAGQPLRSRWRDAGHRHRSGLLAAWSTAWLAGRVSYDDVIEAVVGEEVHRVTGLPGQLDPVPLGWALTALREGGESRLRTVLPVAGDPRGLPGPGSFSAAAMSVGEGVLGDGLGLAPDVIDGTTVLWTMHDVTRTRPDPISLAEADHDLAATLRTAARALTELDVARWRPEAAGALSAIRAHAGGGLAPGYPARAHRVLAQAQRLRAIAELAGADHGAAVIAREMEARAAELRPLDRAARRAQLAAYNAVLEGTGTGRLARGDGLDISVT